jgi:cell division protein FtsZ
MNYQPFTAPVKLLGVGGAGSILASQLVESNLPGIDLLACNTDAQALDWSKTPHKLLLGRHGIGAGLRTEIGHEAAVASTRQLRQALEGTTDLLVLLAGLGGGTGTGASPVVARLAHDLGIPVVAVVTLPFSWEGQLKHAQAQRGLALLQKHCEAVLVHDLEDIERVAPADRGLDEAFALADERVSESVQTLLNPLKNGDTHDVLRFVRGAGRLYFGFGRARGEHRAERAVRRALRSMVWSEEQVLSMARPEVFVRMGFSRNFPPSLKEQKNLVKGLGTLNQGQDSQLLFTMDETWREELDCSVLVRFVEGVG